jgi:hypothetical protein
VAEKEETDRQTDTERVKSESEEVRSIKGNKYNAVIGVIVVASL